MLFVNLNCVIQVEHGVLKIISTDSTGYIYVPNAGMLVDVKNIIVDNDILNTRVVSNNPMVGLGKFIYFCILFIINIVLEFVGTHYKIKRHVVNVNLSLISIYLSVISM